jgi:hypothetical protein
MSVRRNQAIARKHPRPVLANAFGTGMGRGPALAANASLPLRRDGGSWEGVLRVAPALRP